MSRTETIAHLVAPTAPRRDALVLAEEEAEDAAQVEVETKDEEAEVVAAEVATRLLLPT